MRSSNDNEPTYATEMRPVRSLRPFFDVTAWRATTLQRSQMAHLAPPASRVTARVQPTIEKQPEATADADSRRTGGWGWVKTILLGFDPEAERR